MTLSDALRRTLLFASLLGAVFGTGIAGAETWPSRPLTLIVPYSVRSDIDAIARRIAPALAARLGQPVTIDNTVGAEGVIGTDKAARARPDGYTLLLAVESSIVIARMVTPGIVRYDGLTDFEPITLLGTQPLVLVGKPTLAAPDAQTLHAELQAWPDRFNYATPGVGTASHLGGELLQQRGQVQMTHIPYRIDSQILTDLTTHQIDLAVLPLSMAMKHVAAGKIKAYGVLGPVSPAMPGIPSLAQVGVWKDADVTVWQGIFVPKGTDPAVVERLNAELLDVLKSPELLRKFDESGVTAMALGPQEFAAFLQKEDAKFSAIVTRGNSGRE